MKFVGVDLAWSAQKRSGVAVIDDSGNLVRASGSLRANEELCEFAGLKDREDAVVAIDAPLIVKNVDRQRPVERELTRIFGPYDAGPFPANLSNPAFRDTGRIQKFIGQLEQWGFKQEPAPKKQRPQRVYLEVFPSPAQVALFPCFTHGGHTHCRPPRYKHKPNRPWVETQCEWEMYRARLLSFRAREPALRFSPEVKKAMSLDVEDCTGVRYKALDDLLDGIFCAYLAYYFWHWGAERIWVAGDMNTGYVTLPRCTFPGCRLETEQDSARP